MRFHTTEYDFYPVRAFSPRPDGAMTLEGGKGSSAPAPDPRLVEGQLKSMGYQDEAIQQMMRISNEMLPMQRQQMQFGLDSARTAYGQAQDDRQFALGRRGELSGMQDTMLADARAFNADDRGNEMTGRAVADITQQADMGRQQMARGMQRMGVNPSSGRMQSFQAQSSMTEALAKASAGSKMREAARMEGYGLTDRATNALSGYPAMGMQASGAGVGYGMAGLDTTNKGLAGMNSGFGAGTQAAGQKGANATGMFNAQANFKNQQDDNQGEFMGSLLGAGAQVGAAFISDRRLKQDITLVGKDYGTNLNIYEFAYKDDPDVRYRGVMADEVMLVRPEAVLTMETGFMAVDYRQLGFQMQRV